MFNLKNKKIWFSGVLISLLLLSGCSGGGGSGDSSGGTTTGATTSSGGAIDGYLQGATVFADITGEGEFNATEPNVLTDNNGDFTLTGTIPDGTKVYARGGIDLSTGYAFEGRLATVYDSSRQPVILSPLTTFVSAVMDNDPSQSFESASGVVATNLGVDPADVNKDPMTQPNVFLAAQKVQKTVEVIAAATGDSNFDGAYGDVFASLATVTAANGGTFDASALVTQVQADGAGIDASVATAVSTFLDTYVETVDEMQAQNVSVDDLDDYGEVLNTYTEVVEGALDSGDAVADIVASVGEIQTTLNDMNVTQTADDIANDTYVDPLVDALAEVENTLALVGIGTTATDIDTNLTLTSTTATPFNTNDLNLTWSSNSPAILIDGTVVQSDLLDINVELKARVENNLVSQTKIYNLIVKRNEIAPLAQDATLTLLEDANNASVTPVFSDANGDTVSITAVSTATKGNVSINGDSLNYIPYLNAYGSDSFTYTVTDSTGLTATATIDITITAVNDTPTISTIQNIIIDEDTATPLIPFSISDIETTSDNLVITTSSSNIGVLINSAINVGGSGDNRTIMLTPLINAFGDTVVTINVSDGDRSSTQTFNLSVVPRNDAPSIDDITPAQVTIDEDLQGVTTVNFSDIDSSSFSVTAISNNENLLLSSSIGINTQGNSSVLTLAPLADKSGTAIITVTVSDGDQTDTLTFNLTVNPINDAPTAQNLGSQAVLTNGSIDIDISTLIDDIDSTTLTVSNTDATNGTVVYDANTKIFTYTNNGTTGADSFTYTVNDGSLDSNVATILLGVADEPAYAIDDTATVNEDGTVSIAVLDNEISSNTSTVSITFITQPSNGSAVVNGSNVEYTPSGNYNGTDSFRYSIANNFGGVATATVNVTVIPVNDAPEMATIAAQSVVEDSPFITIPLASTDIDDGASVVYSVQINNSGLATVTVNGSNLIITPNINANGLADINVTANDTTGTTNSTGSTIFTYEVIPVNDAPEIDAITDIVLALNAGVKPQGFGVDDIDGLGVTVTASSSDEAVATVTVNGDLEITPVAIGTATLTVRAANSNDVTLFNEASFTVTITQNTPPVITSGDVSLTLVHNEALSIQVVATDNDNDNLTYSVAGDFSPSITAGGLLSMTAGSTDTVGSFIVTVDDGQAQDSVTYTVNVTQANVDTPSEDNFSDDETISQTEYDNVSSSLPIPLDTKFYGIWGSDTEVATGNKIYDVDYHEFNSTTGAFYMSDEPNVDATYQMEADNRATLTDVSDVNNPQNMGEMKLDKIFNSSDLNMFPEFNGLVFPAEAEAYQFVGVDSQEDYYIDRVANYDENGNSYSSLEAWVSSQSMIVNNATNYTRGLVFTNGSTLVDNTSTGTVSEVDFTNGFYVTKASAGTWSITVVDTIRYLVIEVTTDGYDDKYVILANIDDEGVEDPNVVWIGDYTPSNSYWIATYFNEDAMQILTGQQPVSDTTGIVGSWIFSESANERNILTFLDENKYVIFHEHDDLTGGTQTAGSAEYGSYVWDENTGLLDITVFFETDGDGGLSNRGQNSIVLANNTLELGSDIEGSVVFTKIEDNTNALVGTWVFGENILTFLTDTDYAIVHTGPAGDVQELKGEFGTYSSNGSNDLQFFVGPVNTDQDHGFSDVTITSVAIGADIISITEDSGYSYDFVRLRYYPSLPDFDQHIDQQGFADLGDTLDVASIEGIEIWGIWAVDEHETTVFESNQSVTFADVQDAESENVAYLNETDAAFGGDYMHIVNDVKIKFLGTLDSTELEGLYPDIEFSPGAVGYKIAYLNDLNSFYALENSAINSTEHTSFSDMIEHMQASVFVNIVNPDGNDSVTWSENSSEVVLFEEGTDGSASGGNLVQIDGTVVGAWSYATVDVVNDTLVLSSPFENAAFKIIGGVVVRGGVEAENTGNSEVQFNAIAKDDILNYISQ